jgi:LysW-gamma-L-lysine carboxypeptidase
VGSEGASVGLMAARVLVRLLKAYSPTGREAGAARVFIEEARRLGLKAWTDGVGNAYAAPPQTREVRVLLAGHIDTVEGWVEPGFDGVWVWGRGAVDAKGPLAAMLAAAHIIAGRDGSAPVAVAALVGEEGDSRGARYLAASGRVPAYVIIGEPTGATRVAVGYRGSVRVRVECRGEGGHTASPWAGDSALDKLIDFLVKVRAGFQEARLDRPTVTVIMVRGGRAGNVLPTSAEALLDARIPPGSSLEELLTELRGILHRDCRLEALDYTPPVRVRVSDRVPRALIRALLRHGIKPRPSVKAGTSDMNILAPYTDSIAAYGPGDPSLAHTMREKVSVEELGLAALVYADAALELAGDSSVEAVELPGG